MNPRNRIELAEMFNKLKFKAGAEIGVADGRYSEILCQKIPGVKLYCIDPWSTYENWRNEIHQESAYIKAKYRLEKYPDATLIRKTGTEASFEIEDESLDFVFIDGDHHFDYVMEDILVWNRKVKKGGVVSGHDYFHFGDSGIIEAVNCYTSVNKLDLKLTDRNNNGHKDDSQPCFWWRK